MRDLVKCSSIFLVLNGMYFLGGERQHHPLSEQFIVPGSGMTKIPAQMLDPFVTNDIYQLRFNIDDNAIEKVYTIFMFLFG